MLTLWNNRVEGKGVQSNHPICGLQFYAERRRLGRDITEQLKVHASQELLHALEVAKQIDYLGGHPTVKGKEAEYS
jgi:hypothetical protein